MSILELKDIKYGYNAGDGHTDVLRGVNALFEQGTLYAVIGRSGSGKSTLLSLMAGLDVPDSGEVIFEGRPTGSIDLDDYRRTCAAVVYQAFNLFPLLTALENIMYPMELCGINGAKAREQALELAQKVSLPEELLDRYPTRISGGEQQRVAVARALAMGRRLILADEPTGNLDSENSDVIIDLLKQLAHKENRCVIVVTHDIAVMQNADVVYRINGGLLEQDK